MLFSKTSGELSPSFLKANRAAQSWKYTLSCHGSTRASALIKKWKMWHDQPSITATHPQPRSALLLVLMNHCSHADFRWPNFFFLFLFFLCFIPCTHSLIPKKSGVRSGFKVKWMDSIVAEENKTIRAYSKASWRCQKDIEVGQQISLSIYTSESVTGGGK